MNNIPLLQKALGEDWSRLSPVIQRHYTIANDSFSCVRGDMSIGYPDYLLPLISLIHLCGGLVSRRGEKIQTRVEKTISAQNTELHWQRTLQYPDQKKDYFYSRMTYLQDKELIETVRFGFGLRLKVSVDNGNLVYRSNGHIWQCGKFRLTFPDWLVLGKATIIETPISEKAFKLDFTIKHPIWGKSYWYNGIFHYCEEA